jgi:hypothetical protein
VQASDGFDTATDASDAVFTVANNAPFVALDEPAVNPVFASGQTIVLAATAIDPEEGLLGDAALAWTSDVAGPLGSGSPLAIPAASLAAGRHRLTVVATDGGGATGSAATTLHVDVEGLFFADGFETDLRGWSGVTP